MLAHSPPLLLAIECDYEDPDMAAEDEEGFTLAFQERVRVHGVSLRMPVPTLQKLITAMGEGYPKLEYLIIMPSTEDTSAIFTLPESFQAPHLRHLVLVDFDFPPVSRLLAPATGLVTLVLGSSNPSTYVQPNVFLQLISSLPRLETLAMVSLFTFPDGDLETQSTHISTMTITLPNLRWFWFVGVCACLEAVVSQITTPRLEKLEIAFFEQPMFSDPHLVQFMNATENLKFRAAKFHSSQEEFEVEVYPCEDAERYALHLSVTCWPFDRQVSSVIQIFNASSRILSAVEHLTLEQDGGSQSYEEQYAVNRSQWHNFLGSFSNVKILRVNDGFLRELSRPLGSDDGGVPLCFFPKLRELAYSVSDNGGDPIILGRRSPNPNRSESPSEAPTITSAHDDAGNDSNT
jgi:hypothetical protein